MDLRVVSMGHLLVSVSVLLLMGCGASTAPAPQGGDAAPPAIRYESHLAAGGELPKGAVLTNPATSDGAKRQAGGALYTAMNCDG